jgi:hypothetical protein
MNACLPSGVLAAAALLAAIGCAACDPASAAHAWGAEPAHSAAATGPMRAKPAERSAPNPSAAAQGGTPESTPASQAAATAIAAHEPIDQAAARAVLAVVPGLASIAASFVPFTDSEIDAALRRGGRSRQSVQVWSFMPAMFVWNPVPEKAWLVLSGRAGGHALFAVIESRGGGRFALAGSTSFEEPEASVAIGASDQYPKQLSWSTCYGCAGEGGTVRLNDDGRVELSYR